MLKPRGRRAQPPVGAQKSTGSIAAAADEGTDAGSQQGSDQDRIQRLFDLGIALAQKRSDAIEARKASGIEEEWTEDEEYYNGIDDANRKEHSAWRTKPPGQIQTEAAGATRSTVFINLTAPYVDTAAASMSDMLLPTDDRGWSIAPKPIPELGALVKGKIPRTMLLAAAQLYPTPSNPSPEQIGQSVAAAMQPPAPAAQPPMPQSLVTQGVAQATAPAKPVISVQAQQWIQDQIAKAQEIMDLAKACAQKAEKRIDDWHVECQYHRTIRESINDAARIGTGIVKGPVPVKQQGVMFRDGELIIEEKIVPGSAIVSAWNFFPDGACGENIHNGSYTWERDELTTRQLFDLIPSGPDDDSGYIASQIEMCIQEGPTKAIVNPKRELDQYTQSIKTGRFEIWYYYGYLSKADLEVCGLKCDAEMMTIPALVTMVNNRVIRASLNPLDSGDFPYDVMPWSKRIGHWAGRGVARQIRTPQRMINAGWRSLMDNAGIASGPMLIFRQGVVQPADGVAELRPRKIWTLGEDADATIAAERAIGVIKVDMMVNELLTIIKEAMALAEITTGLPMLLQGQQGHAPDTLGGMQMLNNNSSVVRRRIAKIFDDCVTEPHVRRYYRWLLHYGDDDSEKGDFVIDARGSSALVQRDLENQSIAEMGKMVTDREFKVDPARWFAEWCKSRHLDPKRFQYTDEEFAALPPPAPDPQVQAATIAAKGRTDAAVAMSQGAIQKQQETLAAQSKENAEDRQLQLVIQHSLEYIEQMKQDGASAETVANLKAMLAATTMKLRTQVQLSGAEMAQADDHKLSDHIMDVHKLSTSSTMAPPVQAPGRAANGHAFDQAPE
ncbi:hypothetical protein GALL_153270 [mine drainage metagenome]|uniref:Portal protein n=1 Tax=mine drainage metagenome TaxID=410659 RepID=A0A1J5SEH5_9ZZZZ